MKKENDPTKFQEHEIDNLIRDYGKVPENKNELEAALENEREKFLERPTLHLFDKERSREQGRSR